MKKLLAFAIVILGFSAASFAQSQLSDNGTATAKIIAPLRIVKGTNLRFGTLATSGTAGTVKISTAGGRTAETGSINLYKQADASTFGAGTFTVTGEAGTLYHIVLPLDGAVTLAGAVAGTMAVNKFESDPPAATSTTLATPTTIYVGATISVGATQAVDDYSSTYTVSVVYE